MNTVEQIRDLTELNFCLNFFPRLYGMQESHWFKKPQNHIAIFLLFLLQLIWMLLVVKSLHPISECGSFCQWTRFLLLGSPVKTFSSKMKVSVSSWRRPQDESKRSSHDTNLGAPKLLEYPWLEHFLSRSHRQQMLFCCIN